MMSRNVIQSTLDEFGMSLGAHKKAGSWYLLGADTVAVVNLQRSNYSRRYFINFGLWFIGIGPPSMPKPTACHLQTRVESIVDEVTRLQLERLLDLETELPDAERREELLAVLQVHVHPILDAAQTLEGLASPTGQRLLAKSLLDGDGQRLLAAAGVEPGTTDERP